MEVTNHSIWATNIINYLNLELGFATWKWLGKSPKIYPKMVGLDSDLPWYDPEKSLEQLIQAIHLGL